MQRISDNLNIDSTPIACPNDKHYLLICFVLSISVYVFYTANIFYPIGNIWYHSGTYNYSYITILISAYWISINLVNAFKSNKIVIIPSIWSLIGIFICLVLSLILYASQLTLFLQITMIFLLWFVFCACLGRGFAVANITPILLLLASLPVFELFTTHQIIWIKDFLEFNLSWLAMVDDVTNNVIESHNIFISVNRTYIGLRYLNVVLVLSLIYGHFVFQKSWVRFLYVAISLSTVVLINLVRVVILVIYAHYYGIDETNNILYFAGWLWLLLILAVTFSFTFLLQSFDKTNYINTLGNSNEINLLYFSGNSRVLINSLAVLFLFAGFNYFKEVYRNVIHSLPSANVLGMPQLNDAWKSCSSCEYGTWYPKVGLPDAQLLITYNKKNINKHIDFYMSYYEHQYKGNSLINLSTKPYFDTLWQSKYINEKTFTIPVIDKYKDIEKVAMAKINVNRVILQGNNSKRVVWHWYWIDGKTTNHKVYAKLLEVADIFKTLKTHSALIAISAEFNDQYELQEAEFALFDFINDNYSYLYPSPKRQAIVL